MSAPRTQGYPHIIVQPGEGVQNARKESHRVGKQLGDLLALTRDWALVEPVNQPRNGFSLLPSSSQKLAL
jgi:hypothetical protein